MDDRALNPVRRLVLWDVDGTLVHTGGVGAEVFDRAFEEVLGQAPPQRVRMSGKTDPQIVSEYLALLGLAELGAEEVAGLRERILDALARHLADAASEGALASGTACLGVPEVLAALAGETSVVQSLLTGNIRPNARVKVAAYGLDGYFDFDMGAYGSDSEDRNALVPVALGRLAERTGARLAARDAWVVGDTPRDLACARAAGARCLLVATGRYPYDELSGLGADAVFRDLAATSEVLDCLTG